MAPTHGTGDKWANHYRGYRLHTNPDGDVWWQVYQGTDRLYLEPTPDELIESLLDIKHLGGRVRITEDNDVLTRVEDGDDYTVVWVGELTIDGELVPDGEPEYSVPLRPTDIDRGDLWPSVYDGAKYSFAPDVERIWWSNPSTHKRHPVRSSLPQSVTSELARRKPRGGSFRVTPWNDVLTLVDIDKIPTTARKQFEELPRVVKNVLRLRKERGVEKLPLYVGRLEETPLEVDDPVSLTDPVSADDLGVGDWANSLGSTTETDPSEHQADDPKTNDGSGTNTDDVPFDDPSDW